MISNEINDGEINFLSQTSYEECEEYQTTNHTTMTKLQMLLHLAQRMIEANMDEIAVGEVLIEQLKEEIDNLKVQAFDLLPVVKVEYIEEK